MSARASAGAPRAQNKAAPAAAKSTQVCRSIQEGKPCKFGKDCRYSHDLKAAGATAAVPTAAAATAPAPKAVDPEAGAKAAVAAAAKADAAARLKAEADRVKAEKEAAEAAAAVAAAAAAAEAAAAQAAADAKKSEQVRLVEKALPILNHKKQHDEKAALLTELSGVLANPVYEGYLVNDLLEGLLQLADDKPHIQTQAKALVSSLLENAAAEAVTQMVTVLLRTLHSAKWRVKVAGLEGLCLLAEVRSQQLNWMLPDIVTAVNESLFDTKPEVATLSAACLDKVFSTITNPDITGVIPILKSAMTNISEVPETVHTLASVTFVQTVDAPTLGVIAPLLVRGLQSATTATKRQCAVIINNMAKLVEEPLDASPFLPTLLPLLQRASDEISDPEARAVATRAFEHLSLIKKNADAALARYPSVATLAGLMTEALGASVYEKYSRHVDYVAACCFAKCLGHSWEQESWKRLIEPRLAPLAASPAVAATLADTIFATCIKCSKPPAEEGELEDPADVLCDTKFTLAYGSKVLLHNTELKLLRGQHYGLLGGNDSGKTSLMRAIADGRIDGFPTELRTVFVEADIQGEMSHLSCIEYIFADPRIQACGASREEIATILGKVGFSTQMTNGPVTFLSGGWRMKLALARAMLQRAEILLMDEPTNHLDVINVKWVKDYLLSLKDVTCVMVSHDSGLLNDCCKHILHIKNLKLLRHTGNLASFVAKNPEAKSFFELRTDKFAFKFPQPGFIPGVKSKGKALMKCTDITFKYPCNDKPTIMNVTVQVSLSSRVACLGVNGAGKSTLIKVLTGELEPTEGTVWKHPACRVAYVAQHAFHHIENHLTKTANEYIRWRYQYGEDKEGLEKVTMVVTPEEEKALRTPRQFNLPDAAGNLKKEMRVIDRLTGVRRPGRHGFEYEVAFERMTMDKNLFLELKQLEEWGFSKHVKIVDVKTEAREGMYQRALTQQNVEEHLEAVGLDREFGTHNRISALSGGQKVKVVLAAAMWNQPHILILDEPTNYLDRDSLGALAGAVREFEGGVVMITHNNEFCSALCPETWVMENGRLDCRGDPEWMKAQMMKEQTSQVIEEMVDGAGNVIKVKEAKKATLSRQEQKARQKKRAAALARGEVISSDEEDL